jgi:hypothetical protein
MQLPLISRPFAAMLCAVVIGFVFDQPSITAARSDKKAKPSVAVRASPAIGFSPARMVVTAELKGGADDYEAFYCASVEWEWGDGTKSEFHTDCDPYEAGKSEIKRRFTTEHVFDTSGDYRIQFRLKQKKKVVGAGSIDVKIRPGARDGYDRNH